MVKNSSDLFFGSTTSMPITSSLLLSFMPRTPEALRPISRTSFSLKRMAKPALVAIMISSVPVDGFTHSRLSSVFNFNAIKPLRRTFSKSVSAVFLIVPLRVTITRYLDEAISPIASRVVTFSFGANCKKFTSACPLAVRLPTGMS